MKKLTCMFLSISLVLGLAACSAPKEAEPENTPGNTGVVTDFQSGESELHEAILPWEFEEGEEVENPYYKRTVDDQGTPVYAVLKASNNQVAYLPMGSTVVYAGNSDNCYFERTTNTYKLDGEPKDSVQYQLYVTAAAPEMDDPVSVDDHPAVAPVETKPTEPDAASVTTPEATPES